MSNTDLKIIEHAITSSGRFDSLPTIKPELIVVHCAASKPSMLVGTNEIDQWHVDRGWRGCGYHYVINRNGQITTGRPDNKQGAHAVKVNSFSIGVCMAGGVTEHDARKPETNFTAEQYEALYKLLEHLLVKYELDDGAIVGHCDVELAKPHCPGFNADIWFMSRKYDRIDIMQDNKVLPFDDIGNQ